MTDYTKPWLTIPARDLGLRDGLEVSKPPDQHPFRCGKCDEMQPKDSWRVWVRRYGSKGGWCVECARRLKPVRGK